MTDSGSTPHRTTLPVALVLCLLVTVFSGPYYLIERGLAEIEIKLTLCGTDASNNDHASDSAVCHTPATELHSSAAQTGSIITVNPLVSNDAYLPDTLHGPPLPV